MGRNGFLTLVCLVLIYGCASEEATSEAPTITKKFKSYLDEAFQEQISEEVHFYLFTTEKVCALCKGSHFSSFTEFQQMLIREKLTIISDFPCETRFDSRLQEVCRYDSLSLFNNYSFPKSYLTIYKTSGGNVDSYAFYKEPEKFMAFLHANGLLREEN